MSKLAPWKVHKFGGTSVLNADRIRNVAAIVLGGVPPSRKAIVVSAMKGVTDDLIRTARLAEQGRKEEYLALLAQVRQRHVQETGRLLENRAAEALQSVFEEDFGKLDEILRGVFLLKKASEQAMSLLSGMGEVWSAQLLDACFRQGGQDCAWLDARQVLIADTSPEGRVAVDWERSRALLDEWLKAHPQPLIVITGFVARTTEGTATTLGRNGSDFSGSIFAALLGADELCIWTDVDGILSADPRSVPEAVILEEMSYSEVTELAYFGANVVHPATMAPAIRHSIPIWIRNSLRPEARGTLIRRESRSERPVKGFTTIDRMALLNVEGTGMMGVPGVAERLFGALRSERVSVVLISQASSEQSICFSVPEDQAELSRKTIEKAFYAEIQLGLIQRVEVTRGVAILAAVGDTMAHTPGVAGKFFTALGRAGVNVRAIAQGSSERNISAVIDSGDAIKALRTVHSEFIGSRRSISVGLIGPGLIGSTFLRQLGASLGALRERSGLDIQVRAIANSRRMLLSDAPIDLSADWKQALESRGAPLELSKFSEHVQAPHLPHGVILDCTATVALIPRYSEWLGQGIHLITPNKKANAGALENYERIHEAARAGGRHFLYSTNVGAGLPILQTLKDLHATGDRIHLIQGILSGTLSYLFSQFDGSRPFSEIVLSAREAGYTEPDPRDDLSGLDMASKFVILGREIGRKLSLEDLAVENLVPEPLRGLPLEQFLARIGEMDAPMQARLEQAKASGSVLRYVGTLSSVGLLALPMAHPFARVAGADNIVLVQTERYFKQPLVIQGPGAGPEVTAAGVFADLLRLSKFLGVGSA